jgi:Fe-S cluster biogenesis protein NfuA
MSTDWNERIEQALDEIRPFLRSDGGDISLVDVDDEGRVTVRLQGNCVECKVNQMTLKNGVETIIKKHIPEVSEVREIRSLLS